MSRFVTVLAALLLSVAFINLSANDGAAATRTAKVRAKRVVHPPGWCEGGGAVKTASGRCLRWRYQ
jgi:hypothetical protein